MATGRLRYPGGAKLVAVLALGLFSVPPVVAQTTWYVATDGSDGYLGTLDLPFATLPHALTQAGAGDTITLRGGHYAYEDEIVIYEDNLTIRSHDGEWAVVQTPNHLESIFSVLRFVSQVNGGRLERLELIGGYHYGVMCDGDITSGVQNITISECRIHDTGRDCIKISSGAGNITVERCELYNSGVGPLNVIYQNAEGVDIVNADNVIVRHCYVHDISTTGMYTKGGSRHNIFEGNLIINTGTNGIASGFETDDEFADANTPYATEDHIIRNNIIINTGLNNTDLGRGKGHNGIVVKSTLRVMVVNNTVINAGYGRTAAEGYPLLITDVTVAANSDLMIMNNLFYQESGHGSAESTSGNQVARLDVDVEGTTDIDFNVYYHEDGDVVFKGWDDLIQGPQLFAHWQARGYDLNGLANQNPPYLADLDTVNGLFDAHLSVHSVAGGAGTALIGLVDDFDGDGRAVPFDVGADQFGGTVLQIPPPLSIVGTGNGGTPVPLDIESPTTPQNLVATGQTFTTITLDWEASTDNRFVVGYRLYRDDNPPVATGSDAGYTDSGLTPATAYTYKVSAIDRASNESGLSEPVVVTTDDPGPDNEAPSAPTNLASTGRTTESISLVWEPSTDNFPFGVTEYRVFRDGGTSPIATLPDSELSYPDSGLCSSTSYTYHVTARDAAGNESELSNTLVATTTGAVGGNPPTFGPLDPAVDAILDVLPAPGAVDVNVTELRIRFPAIFNLLFTEGKVIRVIRASDDVQVGPDIDPEPGHPSEYTDTLVIDLTADHPLEGNTAYYITADNIFARIGPAPWNTGPIAPGVWSFTTGSVPPDPGCGPASGDFDQDGDVDLDDYAAFVDCMEGADAPPVPDPPATAEECLIAFDSDFDEDVDLTDFAEFQEAFTGEGAKIAAAFGTEFDSVDVMALSQSGEIISILVNVLPGNRYNVPRYPGASHGGCCTGGCTEYLHSLLEAPELAAIVAAWSRPPEHVRQAILTLARGAPDG